MVQAVVAHFRDRAAADSALEDMLSHGVDRDEVSIVGRGRDDGKGLHGDKDVSAGEGAALGGIAGLLLGVGAMLIPGIGPILAVGPLSLALAGAVTGGVTGAVAGGITAGLVHIGVDEDDARYYDERVREGGVLLTARTDDMTAGEVADLLRRHGGDVRGTTATTTVPGERSSSVSYADRSTATAGDWNVAMPRYRSSWEQRYGTSGGRWEDYEPTYRYGWEMRNDPRYHGRSYAEVEPSFRRDYETRHHNMPWDRAGSALRDVWENVT